MRACALLIPVALLVTFATRGEAALITLNGSWTVSGVTDENLPGQFNPSTLDTSALIPTNTAITATKGGSSSTTTIGYNEVGGETIFAWDLNHTRAAGAYASAGSFSNYLLFSVNENAAYELSGFYDMTGDGTTYFAAVLFDQTTSQYVFYNEQFSDHTPNESFSLSETGGGDAQNLQFGTSGLTGSLLMGHQYSVFFNSYIFSGDTSLPGYSPNTASAVGNVTFSIAAASGAVPEPSSLALLGLGVLGMVGVASRRFLSPATDR